MIPLLPPALLRRIVYPIYRGLRRDGLFPALAQLEQSQWLDSDSIEEIRRGMLRELFSEASEHVPYYRDLFAAQGLRPQDLRTQADMARLPVLTKEIIRREGERMFSTDPRRRGYRSSTGGSTGEPLFFRNDWESSPWRRANTIRALRWAGIEPGDRQALLWGFSLTQSARTRLLQALKNYCGNIMPLSTFDLSPRRMRSYAARLRSFRPHYIVAYPSALAVFADWCRSSRVDLPTPRAVVTSGEKLYLWQRQLIEDVLRCRVFDRYGSREFSGTAHECDEHAGLHVFSDLLHVEVLTEDGNAAGPGVTGEIVVTDPLNRCMPFIRYRTGDLAAWADRVCPCGRGLPLLERIEGRTLETIVTPSGKRVGGFFWTWLSRAVPGIARFQVEQREPDGVIMRIVPGPQWKSEHAAVLAEKIRETCGRDLRIAVETVADIPLTRAGKTRFIISRIV